MAEGTRAMLLRGVGTGQPVSYRTKNREVLDN